MKEPQFALITGAAEMESGEVLRADSLRMDSIS